MGARWHVRPLDSGITESIDARLTVVAIDVPDTVATEKRDAPTPSQDVWPSISIQIEDTDRFAS